MDDQIVPAETLESGEADISLAEERMTSGVEKIDSLEVRAPLPERPRPQLLVGSGDLLEIGAMLFQESEQILAHGRKQRIKLKLGRKTIADIPLTMGAVGALAIVMIGVALTRLTIEVD